MGKGRKEQEVATNGNKDRRRKVDRKDLKTEIFKEGHIGDRHG